MAQVFSGRELFRAGWSEAFKNSLNQSKLQERVEDILKKGGSIRKSHETGRPNNSHPSTSNGASEAAKSIIGHEKGFTRNDRKWFGQNAQEALSNIKKMFG